MSVKLYGKVHRLLDGLDEIVSVKGLQKARHILDTDGVSTHLLKLLCKLCIVLKRVARTRRVGQCRLHVTTLASCGANGGFDKIYIIEDAETMTVQAQNALLLTLEEPPPYVLFLLLCDGADSLLETIRSRAPVLRTQPIPDDTIRAYLREHRCTLSDEDLEAVLLRADGCIGQALTLADARAVKPVMKLRALCDELMEACASHRYDRLPAVLSGFGNKRDSVAEVLSLVRLAVRDLILLRHGEGVRLKYYTDRETAESLAGRFTTRFLLRLMKALDNASESLEGNGNIRLTLMQLAVEITA